MSCSPWVGMPLVFLLENAAIKNNMAPAQWTYAEH